MEDRLTSPSEQLSGRLIEIASWRLATELLRHAPSKFDLVELHPGGHHDGLQLRPRDHDTAPRIALNRTGGAAHILWKDGRYWSWQGFWHAAVQADDSRELVRSLLVKANVEVPAKLPPTDAPVLVCRTISALLSLTAFSPMLWEGRNGMLDIPDLGGERRTNYFRAFPEASERVAVHEKTDILSEPAFRFWFLVDRGARGPYEAHGLDDWGNGNPLLSFESSTGVAWSRDGTAFDLMSRYERRRRLSDVVGELLLYLPLK